MTAYRFATADVFTDQIFGGNQLAVLPDARGLDDKRMQAVTREFNFSETTFVFPPDDPAHTRRVRIFTPGGELPFAGHPTVGTAFVLAKLGLIPLTGDETRIVFEEGVGPVPVRIVAKNGHPGFAQLTAARLPEIGPPPPSRNVLAEILGIDASDLLGGPSSPQTVSCGVPFLFVALKNRDAVARARVKLDKWEAVLRSSWAPEMFVFSRDPEREGSNVRARMFAPGLGVGEDPATGSAAAALAGYLGSREGVADGTVRWVIEQGFEMGRPSIIELEADKRAGAVVEIRVGGSSVLVSEGMIEVPE